MTTTTTWISQTPGAVVTESLLTQVQNEAAAAELSADAAAASAVAAGVSAAAAASSASSASTSAGAAATSAANALTYANQALAAASSLTPIPSGGSTGQALLKASSANYDYAWGAVASSGGAELMPYLLGNGESYTVATGRQGLFAAPVEFAGTGNMVVDGLLIEVA